MPTMPRRTRSWRRYAPLRYPADWRSLAFIAAHPLRPALHWSLLPKYHQLEVAPHMRPDLNETSLLGFLWRYLRTSHS